VSSADTAATDLAAAHRVDDALAAAQASELAGRPREAIAQLTEANRAGRDPRLEIELAALRHRAYGHTEDEGTSPTASNERRASGPAVELQLDANGLPVVAPDELRAEHLRAGIDGHGCLFVPGLFDAGVVDHLVACVDRAFEFSDAWLADPDAERDDEARAWFSPLRPVPPYEGVDFGSRQYTRRGGGVWTADSPHMLFEVIEILERLGLGRLVRDHLGEAPAMSASKCNLRRMQVDLQGGWHQDGSFLGYDTTSLNIWVALSDCGRDAPGLDLVPFRLDHLVEIPPDVFCLTQELVDAELDRLGLHSVSPEFSAGDVLFFDHLFLHQTSVSPGMTQPRYALETWFFGPSHFPQAQIPLVY
jgi:hypothetical protein